MPLKALCQTGAWPAAERLKYAATSEFYSGWPSTNRLECIARGVGFVNAAIGPIRKIWRFLRALPGPDLCLYLIRIAGEWVDFNRMGAGLRVLRLALIFALQGSNGLVQPLLQGGFHLFLRSPLVEGIDRLAFARQRDVPAGILRFLAIGRNEGHQRAFTAGTRMPLFVKIDAGRRILEHKIGSPLMAWLRSISTLLEEGKFGFEPFQDVAIVAHGKKSKVQIAQAGRNDRDLAH
jgi:hypothetical protein